MSQAIDQFETFSGAFQALQRFLQPKWPVPENYLACQTPSEQSVQGLAREINSNGLDELFSWFLGQIIISFRNVERETKEFMARNKDSPDHEVVFRLVARWHVIFLTWYDPVRVLFSEDTLIYSLYSQHFYSCFLTCIPDSFPLGLKTLFKLDLTTSSLLFQPSSSSPSLTFIKQLAALGLLKRFQPVLFSVGYDAIDERIETVCEGEWAQSSGASLEGILQWFRQEIGPWLLKVLQAGEDRPGSRCEPNYQSRGVEIMRRAMSRFEYHIYESLSELRINELFDIVVDFPETMPVLQDLRACMIKTDQRSYLVQKLRAANARRLLHPGADTQDIITQYISLIKSLRVLDPPGVLLSYVAQPIRVYLRNREDTIRCIVTSLVEPGHSLGDELDQIPDSDQVSQGLSLGQPIQEENDYQAADWTPDPVDAPMGYKDMLKDDIVESLVSIYENRDGFVKELQNLLASRLLAVKGFDVTQELTRIEILKAKFGEANLQPCDIMLKDLSDSKRVDTAVHELIPQAPIHPVIISHLFWPSLASSTFRFSPQLMELLKTFEQTYTTQKVDRRLRWLPHLGSVEIDVELEDRTLSLEVTTLQASVIELFGISDMWTTTQLKNRLRITDLTSLRNSLYFWSNHEVLKEVESGVWKLFETCMAYKTCSVGTVRHVIEDASAYSDSQQAKMEKMKALNTFIIGMLANLGALSSDRIFTMMNSVMVAFKGTTTREELLKLLQTMEREGSIILIDNQWKLLKR